jgi:hypothetical protein
MDRIIQTLEIEQSCQGLYTDKQFLFENFQEVLETSNLAWAYSPAIDKDEGYSFLTLFAKDLPLSDFSSDPLAFNSMLELLQSQKKAANTAKIDFSELCFFDVLPDHLMHKWFSNRESAMRQILTSVKKPDDYDILHKVHVFANTVSHQPLSIGDTIQKIKYDIFSSATGRLATTKGSYPILSIKKEERTSIKPQNELFLEIDLNGAEIRTLLAFSGIDQPSEDIHRWNMKNMPPWISRREAKEIFFAWLYNPKAEDKVYEKYYNKKAYLEHFDGKSVKTPFGRNLPVDERKALNYLLQSTTSDIVLENTYQIMKKLRGKKSNVAFTMHDSVILDFAREDHSMVSEIKEIFETNRFGRFLSNISIGKDFGNMKEIQI